MVLLRHGKQVTFYNYGNKEVWKPRFVNSKRFGARILTFFVDKKYFWQSVPDNNLIIEVTGITQEEYWDIVNSNLHLQTLDPDRVIETEFGRIIEDPKLTGNVYVNGLFVCDYAPYKLSYDFKPAHINIDRDRKLVSNFDLEWLASRMWATVGGPKVVKMAREGYADVKYVGSMPAEGNLFTSALFDFRCEHGEKAVPVTTQDEMEKVAQGYKPVIVSSAYMKLITSCSLYREPDAPKVTVKGRLHKWLEGVETRLYTEEIAEFRAILVDISE